MLYGWLVKLSTLFAAIALLFACNPTGAITGDPPDVPPIKLPPEGKPGGGTADGCGGVTERGECRDGVAVSCDVASDALRQVDCAALSQQCVFDPDRGVSCRDLGLGEPGEGPCLGLVSDEGFCAEDGSAIWCDSSSSQIYVWSCAQTGLACAVNECENGVYCCDAMSQPPEPDECERLGFEGECDGQTARWCTGNDTLIELDCESQDKVCALDECATGAYCCNAMPTNNCEQIGAYGECVADPEGGTSVNYCLGDEQNNYACAAGTTCMLDICFSGADCCTPEDVTAACEAMGIEGKCAGSDNNTAVWCENGEIMRTDCGETGNTCAVDGCGLMGAYCC